MQNDKKEGVTKLTKKQECRHPESYCHKCGKDNIPWYAENETFNFVNGNGDGIMCPKCFIDMAEKKHLNIIFKVEVIH